MEALVRAADNCVVIGKEQATANSEELPNDKAYFLASTEEIPEHNYNKSKKTWEWFRKNLLPMLTLINVVAGVVVGLFLRFNSSSKWSKREMMYIQFPGDLYLRMLKSLTIPLIVSSITTAIGGLDLSLQKIGKRALILFVIITFLGVIQGTILASIIQPGRESMSAGAPANSRPTTTIDALLDLVRNTFPANLMESCIAQFRTILIPPTTPENFTRNWTVPDIKEWKISGEYTPGANVLGLIVFSIVHGIVISKLGKIGKPLLNFFSSLGESMMLMACWILWFSPFGIFFLIVTKILEAESFSVMVGQLGLYFFTVLVALILHGFIVIPAVYVICTRKLPFGFIVGMSEALITAFATASSVGTLSLSLNCLEEKIKIHSRVARFVMPIGAIAIKDGTALYEAVTVIFISQIRNIPLTLGQVAAVCIGATLAAIIPQAGIITMVMILDIVGLPAEDISLILVLDWFLDRCRTVVNVLSKAFIAGIVDHLSKNELEKMDKESTKTISK